MEKMSQKGSKQPDKGSIQQQPHINATPQKSTEVFLTKYCLKIGISMLMEFSHRQ